MNSAGGSEKGMDLTNDQKLWLLSADPETHRLATAPEGLVRQCRKAGLVAPEQQPGAWRLSVQGYVLWQAMIFGEK